ncbi:MAG: cyclic nucleotide-binding domain-containing protein [Rubrivivax sp.]|nr:cyclic nucleotide-binding domain-containing protein [Rubrivivax sp.]
MTESAAYEALRASHLGAELTEAQCRTLSAMLTLRDLADGEILVPEGASDNHLYALIKGSLAVARGAGSPEEMTLFMLKAGDLVGELSFLDDNVHYASVVSRGASRVFGLERWQLESLLDSEPHIVYRVMRAITRRVHQAQHRLAAQSTELSNYIFKQHGRY